MELLTGVDLSRLSSSETERVTYQQILHQSSIAVADGLKVTFSVAVQTGGAFAVDWIYAANSSTSASLRDTQLMLRSKRRASSSSV